MKTLVRCALFAIALPSGQTVAWAALSELETGVAVVKSTPVVRAFDGVIEPVKQSTVSAQTSGRVTEVNFDVDDHVAKGSVILRIYDAEQRARLRQEKGALKEAEARQKEAEDEFRRVENLVSRKLASAADLDRAKADLDSATGSIEMAQARIEQAEEQLSHTVVKAPYSGVVVERHVQVGESVVPGQALMTGFSLDELRVVASIPQDLVKDVRTATQATVAFGNGTKEVASQKLVVFPVADTASHTFKVRVSLPTELPNVYPGMLCKVRFLLGERPQLMVPAASVVQRSEVTGLYVVDEQTQRVMFRRVLVGKIAGDHVVVLAGLKEGETVALDPVAAGIHLKEKQ